MSGLSEILRPESFENFVGQEHLFGAGALLRLAIEQDNLFSAILYGPPGCGKSSVARIIKKYTSYEVVHLNGAFLKVEEVKKWEEYAYSFRGIKKILLFVDEIHRLNKKQQDVFLPGIETGTYVLIGTTTESPQHTINPALLSRCRVLRFKKLSNEELRAVISRAVGYLNVEIDENVLKYILENANGDARFALSTYELLANIAKVKGKQVIDVEILQLYAGEEYFKYADSEHYNLASAFIKSVRGSDPDAALYYMARMLNGGEDPRFIARRLVILASEDIGLADPFALVLAVATMQAVEMVGMPECILNLAECVIYLSLAPKSNSSYLAINRAKDIARKTMTLPVPKYLRNVEDSTYKYPHDYGGFVNQDYLPEELRTQRFYLPKEISKERKIAEIYKKIWPDRVEG